MDLRLEDSVNWFVFCDPTHQFRSLFSGTNRQQSMLLGTAGRVFASWFGQALKLY